MSADKADSLCSKRVIPILTAVEKVPNGFAANFPPKDETRDDCSSICPHRWYQSEQKCSEQDRRLADAAARLLSPASNGSSLAGSLQKLVQTATEQAEGNARAAFYLANSQRTALHHITGMTQEYARCVDGFAISSLSLACGLAAATRHAVITPDVIQEPGWARLRWLAEEFDYRACWSFPIEAPNARILGTFAAYYKEPTEAKQRDLELMSAPTRTAAKNMSATLTE